MASAATATTPTMIPAIPPPPRPVFFFLLPVFVDDALVGVGLLMFAAILEEVVNEDVEELDEDDDVDAAKTYPST